MTIAVIHNEEEVVVEVVVVEVAVVEVVVVVKTYYFINIIW